MTALPLDVRRRLCLAVRFCFLAQGSAPGAGSALTPSQMMMFETIHARDLGAEPAPWAQPRRKLRLYGEAEPPPHIKRQSRDEHNRFTCGKPRRLSVVICFGDGLKQRPDPAAIDRNRLPGDIAGAFRN